MELLGERAPDTREACRACSEFHCIMGVMRYVCYNGVDYFQNRNAPVIFEKDIQIPQGYILAFPLAAIVQRHV